MDKFKQKILKPGLRLALASLLIAVALFASLETVTGNSNQSGRFLRLDYQAPSNSENQESGGKYYLSFSSDVPAKLVKEGELPLFYLDILGAEIAVNPFLLNFPNGPAKMVRLNQISANPKVVRATFFLRRKLKPELKSTKNGLEVSFVEPKSDGPTARDSYSLIPPVARKIAEVKEHQPSNELKIHFQKADPVAVIRDLSRRSGKIAHFRDPIIRQTEINLTAADPLDAIERIARNLNLAVSFEDGDIWVSNCGNPLLKIPESFNVEGADLNGLPMGDLLRALGQIAEVNIALDSSMSQEQNRPVQMYLQKMSVRRAIETILQLHDLELREIDDKTLLVIARTRARALEGRAVRVFSPKVPLEGLKTVVEKAMSEEYKGRYSVDEDMGNLVVTGDKEAVDFVQTQLCSIEEKFLQAGEGGLREYFRPLNTKTEELIALVKETMHESDKVKITHDKRTDMILLSGASASVKRALEIVKKLDKPITRQALIHIRLLEIHRTDLEEIGIKLPSTLAATDDIGRITPANYVIPAQLVGSIEKTKAKTLANPTIRCMDKEEATIDISEQIPVKNTVTEYLPVASASLAARTSDNWTTSDIGIKMNVKPEIHLNDEISMEVDIDQTELVQLVEGHPWTAKRQIKTRVRIKDRETVVIGGLIRSKKSNSRKPVPILSKIPILRKLLRNVEHKNENEEKTELVVLITPALVDSDTDELTRISVNKRKEDKYVELVD